MAPGTTSALDPLDPDEVHLDQLSIRRQLRRDLDVMFEEFLRRIQPMLDRLRQAVEAQGAFVRRDELTELLRQARRRGAADGSVDTTGGAKVLQLPRRQPVGD